MHPLSFVELSKTNLVHNIKEFKKLAKSGTLFSVAIKGNAYGHGQNEIVKILEPHVDYFQVDDVEELEMLRKISKKKALVLGYIQKSDLAQALKLKCILAVFSIEQLKELEKIAGKLKITQEIHISVDAYLGREGFLFSELPNLFRKIKKCKHIKFSGIYAHFANIEDTSDFSHAKKQINEYNKILKLTKEFGFLNPQTHISSTSGFLVYEKSEGVHPLIRLGIGIYGMWPAKHLKSEYKKSKNKIDLKPVLSWKTKVAQIKTLQKGMTVGYGLTYKTNKKTKIAIIPQGYADGLDRRLSNNGEVLIKNTRCKIIGRISMNMCTVDISHLSKVKIEDEVVILGKQGKEEISAEEIGEKINTINYEVTTRISSLLPRVVV